MPQLSTSPRARRAPRLACLFGPLLALLTIGAPGCGAGAPKTSAAYERELVSGMHASLLADIGRLAAAAQEIAGAAPTPRGRGWSATEDAAAIAAMKASWIKARAAYEHIEGALAPLFPELDASLDARYDDFLAEIGSAGDADLFDDQGVTGLHALERILYADLAPARVVALERSLPGYVPAAFPATEAEAAELKSKLCARLVADVARLRAQWQPQRIDLAEAFQGLVSLVKEQREKVTKAGTSEEESRYAQRTLADLRANLEGTAAIYALFAPWLASRPGGAAEDRAIVRGLDAISALYTEFPGDAVPEPPATWSSDAPSADDLASPFGRLFAGVVASTDDAADGSVVRAMRGAATTLGFPEYGP